MEKLEINVRAKPKFDPLILTSLDQVKDHIKKGIVVEAISQWSGKWSAFEVNLVFSGMHDKSIEVLCSEGKVRVNPELKYVFVRTCLWVSAAGNGTKVSTVQRIRWVDIEALEQHASFKKWLTSVQQITVEKDTYVP